MRLVRLFLKLDTRKIMIYGLEFLQVLINVASVDVVDPYQFAPIHDLQEFALA